MKPLISSISNAELLDMYDYEPWGDSNIRMRWAELTSSWTTADSPELGAMRQAMLQVHMECCPDDKRWR